MTAAQEGTAFDAGETTWRHRVAHSGRVGLRRVGGLAAFITTFSYLGAFLDPDTNARNLPLAFVDDDRTRGRERGTHRQPSKRPSEQRIVRRLRPDVAAPDTLDW